MKLPARVAATRSCLAILSTAVACLWPWPANAECVPATPLSMTPSSAESSAFAGALAIDGLPGTQWHSRWTAPAAPAPHDADLDLGSEQPICGMEYLPRQDGGTNGKARDVEFYVSAHGTAWRLVSRSARLW